MPLTSGARLGPYEILAAIGAGGMGEVYQARDTRLKRDVAIKVLPGAFSQDPDRLARFQREAEVLATLNHPNIAHIHGLEESSGVRALVMELVEGPTLADQIAQGPIPLAEALPIARQVAAALEAAHGQGIIHRDLKPANIKVRSDGTVKVLDFGLAKALEPALAGIPSNSSVSPTITSPAVMTGMGVILGTAAYMSPEQAKGRPADKRSDVWAFGCVLYEMLTGTRAFEGEDVSETLAAVLRHEPDWEALPATARRVVRLCLEKDPKRRLRDVGDAWRLLEEASSDAARVDAPPATQSRRVPWTVAVAASALAMLVIVALALRYFREAPVEEPVLRLSVALPQDSYSSVASFALSPNGQRLVIAMISEGKRQLWLRALDSQQLQLLPDTNGAQYPFWSPDGRSIGFFAAGKLKTISASGGPPQVLCDSENGGGTWNNDGVILFAGVMGPIQRVSAAGGACTPVTKVKSGMSHRVPVFLPDGNHFFYLVDAGDDTNQGVYVAALDDPTNSQRILRDRSSVVFAASSRGRNSHVLFIRGATLMGQPFDTERLQLTGDAFPVVQQASFSSTGTLRQVAASVGANGVLTYLSDRTTDSQLTWVERSGKELQTLIARGSQRAVALSPDGRTAALSSPEGLTLRDLIRGTDTRFTFPPLTGADPVWSPDGDRIAFSNGQDLYLKDARGGGAETVLLRSAHAKSPSDWSRDGRFLVYTDIDPKTQADLWVLPDPVTNPGDRKPVKFLATDFNESEGQISPNGRWIAYVSDESGRSDVYVRPFPTGSGKWKVSVNRGNQPRWRHDGQELFYLEGSAQYQWMAVPIRQTSGPVFEAGEPEALFTFRVLAAGIRSNTFAYSPADDGQRFLVNIGVDATPGVLNVITNWEKAASEREKAP